MKNNFNAALTHVLKMEGGFADNPKDPGGATNMGISAKTLMKWRKRDVTSVDIRALDREEVTRIYRKWYWWPVWGDDLPSGVDLFVFDWGVNSGPATAIKALQKIVGTKIDGIMGPNTLDKVNTYKPVVILGELILQRGNFYHKLKGFSTFGSGWKKRNAETFEAAWDLLGG